MSRAEGNLIVSRVKERSILSECSFTYPLRLSQQESWLQYVSIIACGFGGGYVEGDNILTYITIENSSKACYRCQGCTKVFKSISNKPCTETFQMQLKSDSFFVFIPEPVMCFTSSIFHQNFKIHLDSEASLVFVDWSTCGRMGENNEFWSMQQLMKNIEVYKGTTPLFIERQDLRASDVKGFTIADRLGRCGVVGSVLLTGKMTKCVRSRLIALQHRQSFREVREDNHSNNSGGGIKQDTSNVHYSPLMNRKGLLASVSTLDPETSLVRFTADNVEQGYQFLYELLKPVATQMDGLQPYADKLYGASTANSTGSASILEEVSNSNCPIQLLRKYDLTKL